MSGSGERLPVFGDTPEFRQWYAERRAHDKRYNLLPSLVRPKLAEAKAQGPTAYAEYLNRLCGVGVFAVTGTVLIPGQDLATDIWGSTDRSDLAVPNIIGTEYVMTQDNFPYVTGGTAYSLLSAKTHDNEVMVIAKEFVENGSQRLLCPDTLARFDLYCMDEINVLALNDERYLASILQSLDIKL